MDAVLEKELNPLYFLLLADKLAKAGYNQKERDQAVTIAKDKIKLKLLQKITQ